MCLCISRGFSLVILVSACAATLTQSGLALCLMSFDLGALRKRLKIGFFVLKIRKGIDPGQPPNCRHLTRTLPGLRLGFLVNGFEKTLIYMYLLFFI